ncbi:hypothetical protein PI124_g11991 [Phytophthora idaei]|nr:hypothetical protein PI125_g11531 [Phytophthora idaei]KAG3157811.1 hypothetical protein PI126_g8130 [Phytophthora idaei]KAG3243179.1 hypothetical protein PI124_g11991 [Phytophthora idaei]
MIMGQRLKHEAAVALATEEEGTGTVHASCRQSRPMRTVSLARQGDYS